MFLLIIYYQVIVHFQFTLSSSSGGSGSLLITNLPFTVAANSGAVTGSGRILDLGQTITVGHYTGTNQISIFKYNGNYAGTDFFTTGFVTYAMGGATVGYQRSSADGGTAGTASNEVEIMGISFAVNENLSIS